MKMGVLYPRSNAHPGITAQFIDGLRSALQHHQLSQEVQLVSESIGFGGVEKEVYEKAEKLLVLEGADMLVAFVDMRILELLKPLLYSSDKLVLVVNTGANYPENWVPQANIVHLTLQHSFLTRLTGKMAARQEDKNAAMATSFYDCGYLHTSAMAKGFMKEGGLITYNYVNNGLYDDTFEIKPLTDHLTSNASIYNLLCVFDSLPASLLYSRLNNFEGAARLHLFVSPMMLEAQAFEEQGSSFKFAINGYLPWHASLENSSNQEFMAGYLKQTKKTATFFSLLGWETGLVIQEIFSKGEEQYSDGAAMVASLSTVVINSPRGEMTLDAGTNYFIAPVYKCSLPQNTDRLLIEKIDFPEQQWAEFTKELFEGVSSGWTNIYLCY